jgi:hypothetical protein
VLLKLRRGTTVKLVGPLESGPAQPYVNVLMKRDGAGVVDFLNQASTATERNYALNLFSEMYGSTVPSWIDSVKNDDATGLLAKGAWGLKWAWDARTSDIAANVSADRARLFRERLVLAETDLMRVVEIHPTDVTAWTELLTIGYGAGKPESFARTCFANSLLHGVTPYAAKGLLTYLTAKWCGSQAKMFEFAGSSTTFPQGIPAHMVVPMAAVEDGLFGDLDEKQASIENYADEIEAAADRSIWQPQFIFDGPGLAASSMFAYCFAFLEDKDALERLLEKTNGVLLDAPFYFLTQGEQRSLLRRSNIRM